VETASADALSGSFTAKGGGSGHEGKCCLEKDALKVRHVTKHRVEGQGSSRDGRRHAEDTCRLLSSGKSRG
jgi:hypothetical protein